MAKVGVRFDRPPGTHAATFKLARQFAAEAMLKFWHEKFVPIHFTLEANRRYGYQPRVGDNEPPKIQSSHKDRYGNVISTSRNNPHYSWVKRRRKRHNKPLVFSGDSEHAATTPGNFVVRQHSANVTRGAFAWMPDYWYRYHKAGVYWRRHMYGGHQTVTINQQPNKAAELTRTTPSELTAMADVGQHALQTYLNHYRQPAVGVAA